MTRSTLGAWALTPALVWAGAGLAQQTTDRPGQPPAVRDMRDASRPAQASNLIRSSDVVGGKVTNLQGENLGKIDDLVIDTDRGQVGYAVLSFGGLLGMGDKLFAIPWDSIQSTNESGKYMLNVDKEKLKNAPGFDKGQWPEMADESWGAGIYKYYGSEPYWTRSGSGMKVEKHLGPNNDRVVPDNNRHVTGRDPIKSNRFNLRRASDLVGTDVHNRQNENLGDINNLVIDWQSGHVVYAILAAGGFLGLGEELFAIPWNALDRQSGEKKLVLDMDKDRLKQAPHFSKNQWPNFADRAWGEPVHRYYGVDPYWNATDADKHGRMATGKDDAWGRKGDYQRLYNPSTVTTVTGTVTSIEHAAPMAGMSDCVKVTLKTDGGDTVVHLGPASFVDRQSTIQRDQRLTVTGSSVNIDGSPVIIASEVRQGDQTIRLRDKEGMPVWDQQGK
jgi:sporulation protein YlmC with PRC-barrel domain